MFRTGDLVKHEVWYDEIYVVVDDNCGHPDIIGSNKGFARLKFVFSLHEHYEHPPSYNTRHIAHRILNMEWIEAADQIS